MRRPSSTRTSYPWPSGSSETYRSAIDLPIFVLPFPPQRIHPKEGLHPKEGHELKLYSAGTMIAQPRDLVECSLHCYVKDAPQRLNFETE